MKHQLKVEVRLHSSEYYLIKVYVPIVSGQRSGANTSELVTRAKSRSRKQSKQTGRWDREKLKGKAGIKTMEQSHNQSPDHLPQLCTQALVYSTLLPHQPILPYLSDQSWARTSVKVSVILHIQTIAMVLSQHIQRWKMEAKANRNGKFSRQKWWLSHNCVSMQEKDKSAQQTDAKR